MLPGDILGKKLDPFRRIPINIGYIWGLISYTLFRMWPKIEGMENLEALRVVDENGKKNNRGGMLLGGTMVGQSSQTAKHVTFSGSK